MRARDREIESARGRACGRESTKPSEGMRGKYDIVSMNKRARRRAGEKERVSEERESSTADA